MFKILGKAVRALQTDEKPKKGKRSKRKLKAKKMKRKLTQQEKNARAERAAKFLKFASDTGVNVYGAVTDIKTGKKYKQLPTPPTPAPVKSEYFNIFGTDFKKTHVYTAGAILLIGGAMVVRRQKN